MVMNKRGRFGYYYSYTDDDSRTLVLYPAVNSDDWTPNHVLAIPHDKLNGFVIELIQMARDLGVTVGEVQSAAVRG